MGVKSECKGVCIALEGANTMNTIWMKIAGVAVVLVVILIVASRFMSDKPATQTPSEEPEKQRNFYDMADRDRQFQEEPKPVEEPAAAEPQPAEQPAAQEAPAQEPAPPPAQAASLYILPSSITQPTTLYFKPMSEIDDIEAQQILPYATAGRSIGRLPVMQYGLMVKACRQIEERWPDSWYAFRAKQLLEEIYERYAANYKITEQELDISRFMKRRQGTEPRTVEPVRR
jgi:Na+-transporting methylmalonyl-CoA/oxaloacetate decarboxylase gamma subunit